MRAWPSDLQWVTPHVLAVQLDQVEGVEEYLVVSAVVPDEIERGNAVVIAGNSFAIDDAGAGAQACQRLNDQREALGEVVAPDGYRALPAHRSCGQ
jgi:hypothetical protein